MSATNTATDSAPTITLAQLGDIIDTLTAGDVWWNDDESVGFSLAIEVDDVSAIDGINDCDCYGRVAWAEVDRHTGRVYRPEGFTGAAVKLQPNGWHISDPVWWEPARDEDGKVYNDAETRESVRRLLSDGFQCVEVKRWEKLTDSLGSVHVVEVATDSLCGIDSLENGYLGELVGDMVGGLIDVMPAEGVVDRDKFLSTGEPM